MKNIIITGSSGNLGRSVTAEFLKGEYHLNVTVREAIENTDRQTAWYPDLTDASQVVEMVESIESRNWEIEATIHLVGGYKPGLLVETTTDDITGMINLNFNTAFNLVHALLPHYTKNGGGKFIFIGAKAAMNATTAASNVAYALSKQLLVPLVQMINEAGGANSISAHLLLPGTLDTSLNRSLMPDADFTKWTSTTKLAEKMQQIVEGTETREIITF